MSDKKVALVTGGTCGLGTAICRRLHRDGFKVIAACSLQNPTPQAWLAAQRDEGYQFSIVKVDVGDADGCAAMVDRLLADTGRLDVLVNNAGITADRTLGNMSRAEWQTVLRTNLDSVFNLSHPAVAPMLAQRWGRIVNISSVNGQQGAVGQVNDAAAKAGMHGFSKSLALEVARHGVTVNTISPGYLQTRMVEKMAPELVRERIVPQIPVGRLGQPDEVAALVAYLVSDDAAFLTGANIAINGGQHMA